MVTLSRIIRFLLVLWASMPGLAVQADTDVRVVGLFGGRAVVVIDGRQHILKAGQTTPEGVKLVTANSESAVLVIDGEQVRAQMDGRVTARRHTARVQEFRISRNLAGMYTTVGSINGQTVSFLVDTGATHIALNAAEARRLGVDFRVEGTPMSVTTASRVERAWGVNLDSVKLGGLELHNVEAVVLEGEQPAVALLGMSYLGRLEITNKGRLMTLRKKYQTR